MPSRRRRTHSRASVPKPRTLTTATAKFTKFIANSISSDTNTNTRAKSVAWKSRIASLLTYLRSKSCLLFATTTRTTKNFLTRVLTSSSIHSFLASVSTTLDYCIYLVILPTLLLLLGVSCLMLGCILISLAFCSRILARVKTLMFSAFHRVVALRSKPVACPLIRPSCRFRIKNHRRR